MATQGMVVFCNIYSTFLQRAYDQVIHDVALQDLPVIFCLDRAGLVGEDGATHHGVFDLAYLQCIPNMIVYAPLNEVELRNMLYTAQLGLAHPYCDSLSARAGALFWIGSSLTGKLRSDRPEALKMVRKQRFYLQARLATM